MSEADKNCGECSTKLVFASGTGGNVYFCIAVQKMSPATFLTFFAYITTFNYNQSYTLYVVVFQHVQATALNAAQVAQSSLAANAILAMVWPETNYHVQVSSE